DSRGHHAVVGSNDGMDRNCIHGSLPTLPLIDQHAAWYEHDAALGHEHIADTPIVTAGAAHPRHVPGVDHPALAGRKSRAVDSGRRIHGLSGVVDEVEVPDHPVCFATATAKSPATGDLIATVYAPAFAAP